jgi:hypothetical protein
MIHYASNFWDPLWIKIDVIYRLEYDGVWRLGHIWRVPTKFLIKNSKRFIQPKKLKFQKRSLNQNP